MAKDYCKSLLGKYQVLSVFTSLRNTAIDWDGVAKEKSLRTTRVINKGTSFVFPIGLADSSMDCHVKDALKGIRHIGLNRTRGFGHVRILPLEETTLTKPEEKVVMNGEVVKTLDETGYVQIRYKLVDDVIISNSAIPGNETLDYIPGSMVLGAMASQYLRKEKLAHTDAHRDPFFSKIFIHGNIVFSNAYIADPEGIRAIPTPSMLYYNKTKPESTELKVEKDNEFKVPLGGYCCIHENSQIEKCGISKIINYHHRRPANKAMDML